MFYWYFLMYVQNVGYIYKMKVKDFKYVRVNWATVNYQIKLDWYCISYRVSKRLNFLVL